MAVLPPYSSHALPEAYRELMFKHDSEIIDFYPKTFKVDLIGKRMAWLGEVLLPMIDEIRLKRALSKKEGDLKPEEKRRNKRGSYLFFHNREHSAGNKVSESQFRNIQGKFTKLPIAEHLKDKQEELKDIDIYHYDVPDYNGHRCNLLQGVTMPPNYLPSNVKIFPNL